MRFSFTGDRNETEVNDDVGSRSRLWIGCDVGRPTGIEQR